MNIIYTFALWLRLATGQIIGFDVSEFNMICYGYNGFLDHRVNVNAIYSPTLQTVTVNVPDGYDYALFCIWGPELDLAPIWIEDHDEVGGNLYITMGSTSTWFIGATPIGDVYKAHVGPRICAELDGGDLCITLRMFYEDFYSPGDEGPRREWFVNIPSWGKFLGYRFAEVKEEYKR